MTKLPQAIIIVDSTKEYNAIHEANLLGIPVFGLIDTNCDPDDVDYVLPGNDDAVRSIKVMLGVLTNAICEANDLPLDDYVTEDDKKVSDVKEETKEVKTKEVKVDETVLEEIKDKYDFIIIDCPAGIADGFMLAVSAAEEALVVTTPHLSSLRDADKVLSLLRGYGLKSVRLVVNRVRGDLVAIGL